MSSRASRWLAVLVFVLVGPAPTADASCGADMCTLDLRGPEARGARYALDLGFQYIEQDHVRIGDSPAYVGEIPAHHNEIETRTEAWMLSGRATATPYLSFSAMLPYMHRLHRHEHDHGGGVFEEQRWDMEGFSDLMVMSYWSPGWPGGESPYAVSLQLGAKLPTGETDAPLSDGEMPEPMARLSTGSFDVIGGAQVTRPINTKTFDGTIVPVPLSFGVVGRVNGHGTQDYRGGNEIVLNLSGGWALTPAVTALAQVNARFRGEDDPGTTGDAPGNTGGTAIYATPGLRARFGPVAAYSYFQIRAYEYVNGIQITAPYHLMMGMSYLF